MKNIFEKYLDNSADCVTIEMELANSYNFEQCYEITLECDKRDAAILANKLNYSPQIESSRQMLFDLIREVWDIAYNYGWQDAQADIGLTLSEIE